MVEEALSPSNPVVLYIWPSIENVPSYDPACLTALLFLQIAIKGRFTVEYCADPDASPSGRSVINNYCGLYEVSSQQSLG